jgi:anti-anti-sigma factor
VDAKIKQLASGVVVCLKGRLDIQAAVKFEEVLTEALDTGLPRMIIDMAGVDYICSQSLRVILKMVKRIKNEDGFIEIIRTQPEVRKVLLVVGMDELLPLGEGTMQVLDVLKQTNQYNAQAMRNVRFFLQELMDALDIESEKACSAVTQMFEIFEKNSNVKVIEQKLKQIFADMNLGKKIAESLQDRAGKLREQIRPYLSKGSIIDVGCGDGKVAEAFADECEIQLIDTIDYNMTSLPFSLYDGFKIPFPDKSFDYAFLLTVLHHCDDPLAVLREVKRVTRKRIIINESVYLNESQRRFNMFFDWFYNRVLHDDVNVPYNFNSPEGWEHIFREEGLQVFASIDIGLDQVTVPEYHWLYVLDVPNGSRRTGEEDETGTVIIGRDELDL